MLWRRTSDLRRDVTITFWHTQAPDGFRGKLLDEIIDDFEAAYPEITVECDLSRATIPISTRSWWRLSPPATPPDCAVSYPSMIADYLKADAVHRAGSTYINDPEIGLTARGLADIFPGYLAECRFPQYGNKYYAFPFTKSAVGMWYNLDLHQGRWL